MSTCFLLFQGFSFVLIVVLSFYSKTEALLYTYFFAYFTAYLLSKTRYDGYKRIFIGSFIYYSLCGTLAYFTYWFFCENTFAPYHDDSFYYLNIQSILNHIVPENSTGYEYFVAFIAYPFNWIKEIEHPQLLPINWLLGALCVVEAVKFANKIIPIKSKQKETFSACFILLNSSFTEGTIHLYRDPLMCLLLIISLDYIYHSRDIRGFIFAVFTGFVRGANGLIMMLYCGLSICVKRYNLNRKKLLVTLLFFIAFVLVSDSIFKYDSLIRGFSGNSSSSSVSLNESISNRFDLFHNDDVGGVMALLQNDNLFIKMLAMPVYMISPIKVGSFIITESYIIRNESTYPITRFRIESVWELVSVVFYSLFMYKLFFGIFLMYKEKDMRKCLLWVLFFLMLFLVTYISMQHRHKMMFILLYPLFYNSYEMSEFPKRKMKCISFFSFLLIMTYNLL